MRTRRLRMGAAAVLNEATQPKLCASSDGRPQPLRFRPVQAGSALFLAAAIVSFPPHVDPRFAFGACCNLFITIVHHGMMIPSLHDHTSATFKCKFSCSDVDTARPALRALRMVDQAFVAYICLHTACTGLYLPQWLVPLACILGACAGMPCVGLIVATSLALTVDLFWMRV